MTKIVDQSSTGRVNFNFVFFLNSNIGWALGSNQFNQGKAFKTTDGGINWSLAYQNTTHTLGRMFFIDEQNGWMSGYIPDTGTILLKTTDAGSNWFNVAYLQNYNVAYSICFTDSLVGYLCGHDGTILKSYDGGLNWTNLISGTDQLLCDVYFVNASTGWVIGTNSVILKTTNGGITFSEDKYQHLISGYELALNYPNPFNSSTKISWQSPVSSWQTLRVYDILGKEIKTLVNEYRPVGKYEVNWNAGNLPSGVYIYRLQINVYTKSKKMLLLK